MPIERRTIDFRPAPSGWRLVYLADDDPAGYATVPMPGWLVLEEVNSDKNGDLDTQRTLPPGDRWRTVVVAASDGANLYPADDAENFWMALGPGESEPPAQLVKEEKASRSEAARRERR